MASSSSSNDVSVYRAAVLVARTVFSGVVAAQAQAALARCQGGAAKGGQARCRQPGNDHGVGHLRDAGAAVGVLAGFSIRPFVG